MRARPPAVVVTLAAAAMALGGCGSDAADVAQPHGAGAMPAAARDKTLARFPDKTIKVFEAEEGWRRAINYAQVRAYLGDPFIPQRGSQAGWWIYPNLVFDGHFVRSLLVMPRVGKSVEDDMPTDHRWIEYMSPQTISDLSTPPKE